jgi:hypothetical protein
LLFLKYFLASFRLKRAAARRINKISESDSDSSGGNSSSSSPEDGPETPEKVPEEVTEGIPDETESVPATAKLLGFKNRKPEFQ